MTLFALFRSVAYRVGKKFPNGSSEYNQNQIQIEVDPLPKEEFRPPSPSPGFTEADLLSSVLKKLAELEEKVDTLQAKPSEMPSEKEELLNAAVCRVDALEAELIATKKVQLCIFIVIFVIVLKQYTDSAFPFNHHIHPYSMNMRVPFISIDAFHMQH